MQGTDRRQIAWTNQRHITEDSLDDAFTAAINAYNNFSLPRLWGSGKHASADGTRRDLYEQNLLSEYHIRYGGWAPRSTCLLVARFAHSLMRDQYSRVGLLEGIASDFSDKAGIS